MPWTPSDSEELYMVPDWGRGYFRVSPTGNLCMKAGEQGVDLKMLIDDLRRRGIALPVLVRFSDIVRARIERLVAAFQHAREEYGYKGEYRGVYPIKVNQDAMLVEDVVRFSSPHHLGLEAGSKPELLIVLAMLDDPEAVIVCNGYKDRAYVQMALLAAKLGRKVIVVIEQIEELDLVFSVADELGIEEPRIGVRAKLSAKGSGRWETSAGDRAKFGLTVREIVWVVNRTREAGRMSSLQMLHFHIGSQVTNIRAFNTALREATRIYTELVRLGANMQYFDVGGGLGVDYDGSRTNFESSMNYDVQEYASTVVSAIHDACERSGIPHPHLVTEAGRALVAHHAALIFDVLSSSHMHEPMDPVAPDAEASEEYTELWEVYNAISSKNLLEPLHDATDIRDQAMLKFNLGLIDLEERATIDELYFSICYRLNQIAKRGDTFVPEEIEPLEKVLADIAYCNFSIFQSAPDAWAINQMFPVMPIHRLDQEPVRRAVLADITCDSDGKIDRFIDRRDVKQVLELHETVPGEPYYLGMFLVGAYQEILGDMHNLFGDTNAVHVRASDGKSGYKIDAVIEGNSIREVLNYVAYDRKRLIGVLRSRVEGAIEDGRLSPEEGGLLVSTYNAGLESYTYLS